MSYEPRRVTLLIIDGARPDVFRALAAAGDLPNVSRHVLEPGGLVPATTVFPSTTGVAYLPFLTGCYPGTCQIPGIRWMDVGAYAGRWFRDRTHVRSYCSPQAPMLNADVPAHIRSLFDLAPDSVALCTPFTRGLTHGRERVKLRRAWWGAQAHYTGNYEILDRIVGRELERVAARSPALVFAVFPGVDGVTHWVDPWHPRVLEVYRQFDASFGRYVRRGGLSGDHLVAIVSDHGTSRIERHSDVSLALEARGLRALRHPVLWRRRPDLAVMISGNAAAHVYLCPGVRRSRRFTIPEIEAGDVPGIPPDLVRFLAEVDGVALCAGTDGPHVVVVSREGRARIKPGAGGVITYTPETADVLRLGRTPLALSEAAWVGKTYGGAFPDAPVQLLQLFRSRRTGDLVIAARPGADLRKDWEIPEHRSGHGSLVGDHMRCVVATNRPLRGPIRTVDIFPLIVAHLGLELPNEIDGVLHRPAQEGLRAAGSAGVHRSGH